MKKILFPTDFSSTSNNAFIYALHFTESIKAELIVLHVYDLPVLHMGGLPANIKEVYDSIELEKFDNFKDQIPFLHEIADKNNLGHIKWNNILKHGDLIWAINHMVEEESIDYVVMGTKGATGLKETFMGSTTGSVIAESDAIIIGIPDVAKFHGIKTITFTTRFRDKDIKALQKVVELARAFEAKVTCLYVKTPKSDVHSNVIDDWRILFQNDKVSFHIIEHPKAKDAILEFLENNQSDMLAMLNYKKGFFEELFHQSLTQKLSYHIAIPILALHEAKLD